MSWYHRKMFRIPHGNQNPTKRYLTNNQILELFSGRFVDIYEKVDGKIEISRDNCESNEITLQENMTGKNTCHNHIMSYTSLPPSKRIILDKIVIDEYGGMRVESCDANNLYYSRIGLVHNNFTLNEIYTLLEAFSKLSSHFGSPVIEGLVIKNYDKQLFGKWINEDFEDKL